jgi:hypothetical protein
MKVILVGDGLCGALSAACLLAPSREEDACK